MRVRVAASARCTAGAAVRVHQREHQLAPGLGAPSYLPRLHAAAGPGCVRAPRTRGRAATSRAGGPATSHLTTVDLSRACLALTSHSMGAVLRRPHDFSESGALPPPEDKGTVTEEKGAAAAAAGGGKKAAGAGSEVRENVKAYARACACGRMTRRWRCCKRCARVSVSVNFGDRWLPGCRDHCRAKEDIVQANADCTEGRQSAVGGRLGEGRAAVGCERRRCAGLRDWWPRCASA